MGESNNGESPSHGRSSNPKRHNAKLCPFPTRQEIVNALANGDSIRAIARALHVSNNTIVAIQNQEWQQVAARKERLAAQAERNALVAGEQIAEALKQRKYSPSALVPVYGVSLDKALALRGDASLTLRLNPNPIPQISQEMVLLPRSQTRRRSNENHPEGKATGNRAKQLQTALQTRLRGKKSPLKKISDTRTA
jgi:hypothetical protein